MMESVVLLLGGNMGDMKSRLMVCREFIEERIGVITGFSSEMESEAWGFSSPLTFLNQAVVVTTRLTPEEVLTQTQSIEQDMGRDREWEREQKRESDQKYSSRVIDVDIISYGTQVINTPRLTIPHSLMHEREFVLRPMAEVAPTWRHPLLDMTTEELLKNVK